MHKLRNFHEGHSTVWDWQGSGRVAAGERHGVCESAFTVPCIICMWQRQSTHILNLVKYAVWWCYWTCGVQLSYFLKFICVSFIMVEYGMFYWGYLCVMKVVSVGKSITCALKLLFSRFYGQNFRVGNSKDFILLFQECFNFRLLRIYIKWWRN
jgi:hypothetical protein